MLLPNVNGGVELGNDAAREPISIRIVKPAIAQAVIGFSLRENGGVNRCPTELSPIFLCLPFAPLPILSHPERKSICFCEIDSMLQEASMDHTKRIASVPASLFRTPGRRSAKTT
jgi:hypothetical protein